MKRVLKLALVLGCLGLTCGCTGWAVQTPWSPEAKLVAARHTFTGVVNALTAMKEAKKISPEDAVEISKFIHAGHRALDRYKAAVMLHQDADPYLEEFNVCLLELYAAQLAAERK